MAESTKEKIPGFLADLEIHLNARIGEKRISVKNLCNMKAGDIFILDKFVGEPIDLYAGNAYVAECEAVEIDKNFGIRVTKLNEVTKEYKKQEEGEYENGNGSN